MIDVFSLRRASENTHEVCQLYVQLMLEGRSNKNSRWFDPQDLVIALSEATVLYILSSVCPRLPVRSLSL